jgi:hypothetical protein
MPVDAPAHYSQGIREPLKPLEIEPGRADRHHQNHGEIHIAPNPDASQPEVTNVARSQPEF